MFLFLAPTLTSCLRDGAAEMAWVAEGFGESDYWDFFIFSKSANLI
jgi:hypothetical protein